MNFFSILLTLLGRYCHVPIWNAGHGRWTCESLGQEAEQIMETYIQ